MIIQWKRMNGTCLCKWLGSCHALLHTHTHCTTSLGGVPITRHGFTTHIFNTLPQMWPLTSMLSEKRYRTSWSPLAVFGLATSTTSNLAMKLLLADRTMACREGEGGKGSEREGWRGGGMGRDGEVSNEE